MRRFVIIAVEHFFTVGGGIAAAVTAVAGVISTDVMNTSIMKKKSYRKFFRFFVVICALVKSENRVCKK